MHRGAVRTRIEETGTSMAGMTRRVLAVLGAAMFVALLLPAAVAVAQEEYPPKPPAVEGVTVSRAATHTDPTTQQLAFTGSSDTTPMVLVAGALVVFGGGLVFVARRRRTASIQD